MSEHSKVGSNKQIWNNLTGARTSFSMENRAFNYVCVISFALLAYCLLFDIYIGQTIMCFVIAVVICIVAALYYFSRYQKKYHAGVIIYAICSYLALIINYYTNSGSAGPTFYFFLLTFLLLIVIGKPKQYLLWIVLHLAVVLALLLTEYMHPEWTPDTYPGRKDRFLDTAFSYTGIIIFMFFIINYLRNYYNNERITAEERAQAISEQNKQITQQNQLLGTANMEKNKLFSIISHDLKTPLDSIKGYLELLSQMPPDANEKASIEAELLEQTKYTSDLLLNLLTWAKAQMQGVTVHLTSMFLKDIVEHATSSKVAFAARKGIKLTYSIDPKIEIIGDKDMLDIVIRNLVNNAIKFTNAGGEVFIKVYRIDHEMGISIHDNGIGIPVDKQDEIFTMKTRSTFGTNNEKGIGLGLMMCKEFMEYQHGKIWFDSTEGVGSVFYITLPVPRL